MGILWRCFLGFWYWNRKYSNSNVANTISCHTQSWNVPCCQNCRRYLRGESHQASILLLKDLNFSSISQGVTFPCIHAVWSRWSPPLERSRMASIAFAGNYAGTVVAMPLSGIFATKYGWESVFYIFGTIGCIWFVLWVLIVKEGPEKDPHCSMEEREFIEKKLGTTGRNKIKHPWKEIFTSPPVYAIIASHFSENWGFYTLLTQLPTFLRG